MSALTLPGSRLTRSLTALHAPQRWLLAGAAAVAAAVRSPRARCSIRPAAFEPTRNTDRSHDTVDAAPRCPGRPRESNSASRANRRAAVRCSIRCNSVNSETRSSSPNVHTGVSPSSARPSAIVLNAPVCTDLH